MADTTHVFVLFCFVLIVAYVTQYGIFPGLKSRRHRERGMYASAKDATLEIHRLRNNAEKKPAIKTVNNGGRKALL